MLRRQSTIYYVYLLNGGLDTLGDEQLVLQARAGDTEAFSLLVRKYANAVYGVAYHNVGDFHFAQDIAQEVFLKAYFKLDDLKEPGKIGSWLYAITKRQAMDWLRSNKRQSLFEPDAAMQPEYADPDIKLDVWAALNKLPERSRLPVILYHMAGYNTRDLAVFLDISIEAVESRLRRARNMLRKELLDVVEEGMNQNRLGEDFGQRIKEMVDRHRQLLAVGKQVEALDAIREAVKLNPNDKELRRSLAHSLSMTGSRIGDTGLLAEAEKEYLELVQTDPNQYQALGYVYCHQGKYGQAIGCFKKLMDEGRPDTTIPLGQAYFGTKDYDEAEKAYQSAINMGLHNLTLGLSGLATTAKAAGNKEKAYRGHRMLINILNSLEGEPIYIHTLWRAYVHQAQLQTSDGFTEQAVASLVAALPVVLASVEESPSVLFDKLTFSLPIRTHEGTDLDWFVNEITSKKFAALRGSADYEKLIAEAKALAVRSSN